MSKNFKDWPADWENGPQCLLMTYFPEGLNKEIYYTCLSWGAPWTLPGWYILPSKMEFELAEFHKHMGREG